MAKNAVFQKALLKDPLLQGLKVYRVGGAVRDALLGWPVYDNDWVVVGATPQEMQQRGFKPVGRDFPVFLHPNTKEEYALARTERKSGHGYAGFQVYASPDVTLEEDLLRRDLTINAIAQCAQGQLTDPFHGQRDIKLRVLRHVSAAFSEDPLRVLRTARFLARYANLGFSVAPETLALMQQVSHGGELSYLAAERVWLETEKALGEPSPSAYFNVLAECGAAQAFWPELADKLDEGVRLMQYAPQTHQPSLAHWRYALLVSVLDDTQRDLLAKRLKLPNALVQLARHVVLTYVLLASRPFTGKQVLSWIEQLDGWRKPEGVNHQLALMANVGPGLVTPLRSAWEAARAESPQSLLSQGLKGAELGAALRERRLTAILKSMEHTHDS